MPVGSQRQLQLLRIGRALAADAVLSAHPEAGRLHLYVNHSDSEYFTAQLTDAQGAEITDDAGDIVVFHEDDTDDDGEPIRVPVTVYDLVQKAMRTCPSATMEQLLVPADEDADCSGGRFYLPLPLPGAQ